MKYMVPLEAWEQVQESSLLPVRLLSSCAKPSGEPIMITRPAWFGNYHPKLDRDRATVQQLYEQDISLLMDMIVTLLPYGNLNNTPNDDELLKSLRKELKPEQVPMYLVFGCQVFLDIHAVIQSRPRLSFISQSTGKSVAYLTLVALRFEAPGQTCPSSGTPATLSTFCSCRARRPLTIGDMMYCFQISSMRHQLKTVRHFYSPFQLLPHREASELSTTSPVASAARTLDCTVGAQLLPHLCRCSGCAVDPASERMSPLRKSPSCLRMLIISNTSIS